MDIICHSNEEIFEDPLIQNHSIRDKTLFVKNLLKCPAFVIHLERSNRKSYFEETIKHAGYTNITIFDAVDGQDQHAVDKALELFQNPPIDHNIRKGELGCLLSHMKLLNHIIDHKIELTTIFEDDIFFHPDWENLYQHYYKLTPQDYDIIFIGNQLESCSVTPNTEIITTESIWCTHAYMITLEGARKLLKAILCDYKLYYNDETKFRGLGPIDIMIKNMQMKGLKDKTKYPFVWYSWNGTKFPCDDNQLPIQRMTCKNTGLVFQNMNLTSLILSTEKYKPTG